MNYTTDFDQIFNPAKLSDNDIPFLSYPELASRSSLARVGGGGFSADIDLRISLPPGGGVLGVGGDVGALKETVAPLVVAPHSLKKRNYTFYDAHTDDPDFQSKRARYFFNPRCPLGGTAQVVQSREALPSRGGYDVR